MKFLNYLNKLKGNDVESNIIRTISFNIVESTTDNDNVKKIIEKSSSSIEIFGLLNELNALLKRNYKGSKYKFDICLEQSCGIENIKIDEKTKHIIKKRWLEYNQKLSDIQFELERNS